jgi:multiple sugar transport system substrate-binding protein
VQASAVAGRLPDLLDLDGPYVAQYAWQGHLRPLGGLMSDSVLAAVLPSILAQGTWRDELYAVGTFDSGLGLYARRSALEDAGVRLPATPAEAWTVAELDELIDRLAGTDGDGAVLDLKLNYEGEWFTYAFQPALRSAGGGLLRTEGERPAASGTLNSRASVQALSAIQAWIGRGRVDPNLDDAAFVSGRVALSWSGHWDFPRYREALGSDLVVVPLPDFGEGTRTGQGSWMWAIPVRASRPSAAVAFLKFLLRPEEVLAMTEANGAVPGTRTAAERSERYGPSGALRILLRQLEEGWAVPRPRTPAYPFASSVFQDVFEALRSGEALGPVLDGAASAVDLEIEDNRGYPGT